MEIMTNLTRRKLRAWIREERMSAREYSSYGFFDIAADERRHAIILTRVLKTLKSD